MDEVILHPNRVAVTSDRERMWTVIRKWPGEFTPAEIAEVAEVGAKNLRDYIVALQRTGYIRKVRMARTGVRGRTGVYRLVRDSGPLHPVAKTVDLVYDPNNDQYHLGDPEKVIEQLRRQRGKARSLARQRRDQPGGGS